MRDEGGRMKDRTRRVGGAETRREEEVMGYALFLFLRVSVSPRLCFILALLNSRRANRQSSFNVSGDDDR
jgi:hypothetical protein